MINVSKNIKHFRNAAGLTQETLAEKISVTCPAVSAWERGVTQPDLNMLIALSEALNVSVEELIYGETKKVGLEKREKEKRKSFFVVLSVFGTFLVCIGLAILFYSLWDELGNLFKSLGSFIPLIVGFIAYMIISKTKKNNRVAVECASVIWIAGYMATNALANSFFNADAGFENLFLVDMILLVPMVLITKAIIPLVVLFVTTAFFPVCTITGGHIRSTVIEILIVALLYVFAFIYMKKNYSDDKSGKSLVIWVAIVSGSIILCEIPSYINMLLDSNATSFSSVITVISFILTSLLITGDGAFGLGSVNYPVAFLSTLYLSFMAVLGLTESGDENGFPAFILPLAIGFVILVISFVSRLKSEKLTAFEIIEALIVLLPVPVTLVFSGDFENTSAGIILSAISVIYGGLLITSGMKALSLSRVNLGLVEICFILCAIMIGSEISTVVKGLTVLGAGALLLIVNKILTGYFAKKNGGQNNE